ncbi:MAG: sugar phosphate isomerase/epimerase [Verrucomicrobia bacterium]|nr:sugar phosphate isomerase/epimerase [Verrucomicrobiota bacterium]
MKTNLTRRGFVHQICAASAAIGVWPMLPPSTLAASKRPLFKISLAEWSLNKVLFGKKMDHLDFPKVAKQDYGIDAIELVNQFFMDKAKDKKYLREFKQRARDLGVRIVLIMCDDEGELGHADPKERLKAVENHYKWVEAAKYFGCHSIRVNAYAHGTPDEQRDRAADGLHRLALFGAQHKLNVIVENHGGITSHGDWLVSVMKKVNLPNFGTLPDFGNFEDYDRYKAVAEMMPYAKAVSAKTHDFDAQGNCIETDYRKMMKIVLDAGYHGHLGIEYEGEKISEPDGIRASKRLLEKVREEMSDAR